jgi:hypothetical protein
MKPIDRVRVAGLMDRYPRCFIGAEAVDWITRSCRLPLGAAEAIGQQLLELGAFHHVLDAHGFCDAHYFYRFREDAAGA